MILSYQICVFLTAFLPPRKESSVLIFMDRGTRGLGTKKSEYLKLPLIVAANDFALPYSVEDSLVQQSSRPCSKFASLDFFNSH
jgi:hypothetical protein